MTESTNPGEGISAERTRLVGKMLKDLGIDIEELIPALWLALDEVPIKEWTEGQVKAIEDFTELVQGHPREKK